MVYKTLLSFIMLAGSILQSCSQPASRPVLTEYASVTTGATQLLNGDMALLAGKNTGLVANQASLAGRRHLLDALLSQNVTILKVFTPEHGFRGSAADGEIVNDTIDPGTGIPILSLYGDHRKPTAEDMAGIDLMLFDLQDVGVRVYTYLSTLTYVMEACAEHGIPLVVLDRPSPNGFYVDGPVLDTAYRSFVGLHPVPLVYGMTIGEFSLMINGEHWLNNGLICDLTVIPLEHYTHNMIVKLPVKPSPNLPTWQAVYLYPTLCLFEGTVMSVGRGTDHPFEVYGHPDFMTGSYVFTPESRPGASLHPPHEGVHCYGQRLSGFAENYVKNESPFTLVWLLNAYREISPGGAFFNAFFTKLAGGTTLQEQIEAGMSETAIRETWKEDIRQFKLVREKYLLYD